MKEIRWHARAGQGAKTASQLFATAMLRSGKFVQAFPEYGPERRGAPIRAYTRFDERPIRRHDSITNPDAVVVLEPSLMEDPALLDGVGADTLVLLNADEAVDERVLCVPASRLSARRGSKFANLIMAGALAAALHEPAEPVQDAAVELLGKKVSPDEVRAAVEEGYEWLA
jgi:pyruvate ferredoxin oxidoreductase gamma subunit